VTLVPLPPALPPETLAAVLGEYAVGALRSVPRPGGGTANANWTLDTNGGTYFLKRRNPKYSAREYVAFDHRLMEHLAPSGLGTPLAVPTRQGTRWLEREGAVYELFPFQPGAAHDPSSQAQLTAAGRRLAAFHRATRTFAPPPGKEWPRYHDPRRIREGIEELAPALRERLSAADLAYLWAQVERLERAYPDICYHALPKLVVHGDYHPGNLLFLGGDVAGVFDLDWATEQPRLLDLADGVLFFAGRRATPIDAANIVSLTQTWQPCQERTRVFLDGYRESEAISATEWQMLPDAVRARWLYSRVAGRLKLPEEQRPDYFVDGLLEPLRALDAEERRLSLGFA
jgi:homoserine kinase type II